MNILLLHNHSLLPLPIVTATPQLDSPTNTVKLFYNINMDTPAVPFYNTGTRTKIEYNALYQYRPARQARDRPILKEQYRPALGYTITSVSESGAVSPMSSLNVLIYNCVDDALET